MSQRNQNIGPYEFGPFRLNVAERVLTKGRQVVPLTPKAFDTLVVLVRNSGHVVEKEALLKEVWPGTFVEEGVLAVNVAAIRKALTDGEEGPSYIETVPRRGYRFVGEVQTLGRSSETELVLEKPGQPKKSWLRLGVLGAGLIALITAGIVWYLSRSRPSSPEPPSQPIPLTSYPGAERNPSFSPDGRQVAFTWNGSQRDNFDIYVKLVDGGNPLRLTSNPARDELPAWSPDGGKIAFVRGRSLFVISPLGGAERKLADIQAGQVQWTRDSRSLIVSAGESADYHLVLLSEDTGELSELTPRAGKNFVFGDLGFAISPDGRRLAIGRFQTSTMSAIFLMPLAGGIPWRLIPDEIHIRGVTWTNDGRELVYSSETVSVPTLWRRSVDAPIDSPSQRVEGAGPGAVDPVISHPAPGVPGRLAYVTSVVDINIWVRNIADAPAQSRQLIASTRGDADPQFSPDGRRIAFASERSGIRQIWIAKSDGSGSVQLTSFSSGYTNAPRWSPDGTRLVFSSIQNNNRDLYTISPDGGPLRRLTFAPSEEGRPSWSRNGRWIYCYSNRTGAQEVWKIPAEGGEMLQVTTGGGHESFESPNGRLLYYEDYGVKGLQSLPTESTGAKQGTVVLPSVRPGYWAVAERGIYFVEFDERLAGLNRLGSRFWIRSSDDASDVSHLVQFFDFQTRKVTQVGTIEKRLPPSVPGFSVTPDGSRFAWSQIDHAESDLMMIENFR